MPDADDHHAETLAGFVEQNAQHRPDGIAIHFGEAMVLGAVGGADPPHAAGALQAAGVQRGQRWPSWKRITRPAWRILFAAASLGAVPTIVNWRVIGDELVHVLDDSGARLLFVGAELYAAVEANRSAQLPGSGTHRRCGGGSTG